MKDLRDIGNNNRFKYQSAITTEIDSTADQLVVTLPVGEYLVSFSALDVITADSTSGATMDIKVNGVVVNDEVKVDTTGVQQGAFTPVITTTGGDIEVVAGSTAPVGDGKIRLVMTVIVMNDIDGNYISGE